MNRLIGIALVMLSLGLGAFQEQLKININSNLSIINQIPDYDTLTPEYRGVAIEEKVKDTPYNYYFSHDKLEALYHLSSKQLYYAKWFLTIVLVVMHFIIGYFIVKLLVSPKQGLVQTYLYIYGIAFTLAALAYGIGPVLGLDFYPFSRRVVGFLQSIIPAVFVFFISKLNANALK